MTRGRYKNHDDWLNQGEIRINPNKQPGYNTEYAQIAERLAATGASELDIAYLFGVSERTLKNWKRDNKDFKNALKKGKELTLAYLLAKGIKAAGGYELENKVIEYIAEVDEDGNEIPETDEKTGKTGKKFAKIKKVTKSVPVNERMLMFLVSCLDRQLGNDNWLNKQYLEKKESKTITHKLDAGSIAAQIDKLSVGTRKYVESRELPKDLLVDDVELERQEI